MPIFQSDKALRMMRRVKKFLRNPKNAVMRRLRGRKGALMRRSMRSKKHDFRQVRHEIKSKRREDYKQLRNKISKIESELKGKNREIKGIAGELRSAEDPAEKSEHKKKIKRVRQETSRLRAELHAAKKDERAENIGRKKRKKRAQQEIFHLERELGAAKGQRAVAGALPDFVIIGEKKCGTTFLYHLLGQHPFVEPTAKKELHFFDAHFDLGVEWYRQCFPQPRWEDGRKTITGEATPYMSHRHAPERMAEVVPHARLIALLRNPVERTYSDYQQMVRKGRETRTFEEAIEAAEKARSLDRGGEASEREDRASPGARRHWYLSRSIYVDQLLRWSEFFPTEQMLVLKSEDFFEKPNQTLKAVFSFLDLPEWEPEEIGGGKRNEGRYEGGIDPATKRRLEEYFEPHNKRLYDFLGTDFGW